ncbi:type II secretion system inner membrane protein GspF [Desulfurispirillum indicum]|uniref:General secretion pathway protein F n=1 Tax=Desulfurispirillum indicum (strain ATCC BAA-1389 / DSM 22839 / S5) TaxID=653733 RepID=E6W541_DESIS|nr:type II secretion system inner membrane protein GspF [Desulfurispirillum indicum]ADU66017.1 general secretion pathway protein F [Desulfurispirillum indicum S5]UCZ57956.1 type II secretion system inner membrane protein GspF [Desulfurispirillum indicum]
MAAFEYQALDGRGRTRKGILEADSPRQVRQQLREKGWTPLQIEATHSRENNARKTSFSLFRPSMSVNDLSLCTRQMATLIQAGLPVEEALKAVAAQTEKNRVRSILLGVRAKVMEGYSLAKSLAQYPRAFPDLYRSTVAAGEHAGHLDLVLERLADYTEGQQRSRQKVQLALLYPAILTVTSILIVTFLLGYVVPDVIKVFVDTGQELPGLTIALISLSDFVKNYGLLSLLLIATFAFLWKKLLKRPALRMRVHETLLKLPMIGRLSRGINTARFASTLSILAQSGVPLVEAIRIAGQVLGNDFIKERSMDIGRMVSEGESLHLALDKAKCFPPMMIHMVASGESSGELDTMLSRVAANQERDMESLVATFVGLFEPFMLVVMGTVVLLIVLAILMPILSINQLVM